MLKKFLCWLFGHRFVKNVGVGYKRTATGWAAMPYVEEKQIFEPRRFDFCLRCGLAAPPMISESSVQRFQSGESIRAWEGKEGDSR